MNPLLESFLLSLGSFGCYLVGNYFKKITLQDDNIITALIGILIYGLGLSMAIAAIVNIIQNWQM